MKTEDYLNKQIEDKTEKVKTFTSWFNFYWTLNIVAITIFHEQSFRIEVAFLFSILTFGSIITSIIILNFNMKKAKLINSIINQEFPGKPSLIFVKHEILWNLTYFLSFVILFSFWFYLLLKFI